MVERRTTTQARAYVMSDAQVSAMMAEAPRQRARPASPPRVQAVRTLEALHDDGRIRKIQLDAGLEIRRYWDAWCVSHLPRVSNLTGVARAGMQTPDPPALRNLAARYKAWAAQAEARIVRGEQLTALQIVCDLCLRDWSPWQLRREYRISDVRALRIVQEELLRYAEIAGWRDIEDAA